MKKKSKAQIFLEQVEMLDTIIENKLIEQRQWHDLALNITANMDGERVQSSGTKSKMAEAIDRCIDIEREVVDAVNALVEKKQEILRILEKVNSPTGYRILHMRYIQLIDLSDIAKKLNKEYSWVTTTHGRALKNVQNILQEKGC
jgi:hypothetical protein